MEVKFTVTHHTTQKPFNMDKRYIITLKSDSLLEDNISIMINLAENSETIFTRFPLKGKITLNFPPEAIIEKKK